MDPEVWFRGLTCEQQEAHLGYERVRYHEEGRL
jgi:hypothetical protein